MGVEIGTQIIYFAIILISSTLASFAIVLNRFAKDKDKKNTKYTLVYISDAIVSIICGLLLGLISIVLAEDNIILLIIASVLGGYLGKTIIPIILKIFSIFIKIDLKDIDIKKITKEK